MVTRALDGRGGMPAAGAGRVWLGPRARALGLAAGRIAVLFALVVASLLIVVAGAGSLTNQWRLVPVRSDSMSPSLRSGDAVIATPISVRDVRRGDVIVYHAPTHGHPLVVHRVDAVLRSGQHPLIRTKGDASKALDPWRARLQGSHAWRLSGTVPFVGSIVTLLGATWLRTLLLVLGVALVALSLRRWARPRGDGEGETEGEAAARPWRRREHAAAAALIPVLVMLLASSASADFGTVTADTTPNNGSYTADALSNFSANSLSNCVWTGSQNIQLTWTANPTTWKDGHEVQRSTNGGAFGDLAASNSPYTDATATTPTSNTYTYQVQGTKNSWRSSPTNTRISTACQNAISTIAGTGTAGNTGDGGAATSATLASPTKIAVDASGNVYIADTTNNRVRKVSGGTITAFAGTGTAGNTGDGGAATAATLSGPKGVAVDASGNVFISDTGNNHIREVQASTGNIVLVAGASGSTAAGYVGDGISATNGTVRMSSPMGITVDSSNNVYFSDQANQRIRKFTVGGNINTVVGNGTGGYNGNGSPGTSFEVFNADGLSVDSSGNVYIADRDNNRIRKYTVSTTTLSTVAGTGTAGSTGDGGAATSATLSAPADVVVDGSTVYVADTTNNKVRKFTVGGNISTVVGTGTASSTGDGGRALDATVNVPKGVTEIAGGDLYVSEATGNRVRKIVGPV